MDEASIFTAALERKSPGERSAFLDEACGGDPRLRAEIEQLLAAHDRAGQFLEQPPAGLQATIATGELDTVDDDAGQISLHFLTPSDKPNCLGTLGQYEVVELIGRGGMGVVLRAYDTKLNRVVAIKAMAPELAASAAAAKRFLREARAAAAVSHDHVVTIHGIHEDHLPPFIVMECVDGVSLQEKIDRAGVVGLKETLRIGMQISQGLAAAHEQGLVHRDVKPANILLENGVERVKLTDFGLARAADDVSVTQTGQIAGSPLFMSPEQAQGHAIDSRSDLFSLGSVLYTMCTGRPPFPAASTLAMLRRVSDDDPRPIRQVNPDTPDWLEAVILKLLAKSPDDRFQSASEVAQLLGQYLAHLQHPTTAPMPRPVDKRSSQQKLFDLDEELGFVETTLRIYAWVALMWAVPAMLFAVLVNVVPGNFQATFFRLNAPWALVTSALSLVVSSLSFIGMSHVRRRESYRMALAGNMAALFPVNPFLVMAVPWSICSLIKLRNPKLQSAFRPVTLPTRSWPRIEAGLAMAGCLMLFLMMGILIYVRTNHGTLRDEATSESPQIRLLKGHTAMIDAVEFTPDGSRIVTGGYDETLRVWDSASGTLLHTIHTPHAVTSLAVSPQGDLVASGMYGGQVVLWDLSSRRDVRRMVGHERGNWRGSRAGRILKVTFSPDGSRLASGGDDLTVRVWEVASGNQLAKFETNGTPVQSIAWSSDGERVLAAEYDGTLTWWNVGSQEMLRRSDGDVSEKWTALSPDDRRIATSIGLLDAETFQLARKFENDADIRPIAPRFSRNGRAVVAGSWQGLVRVWDAVTGNELARFEDPSGQANRLAISPDGRSIAFGGGGVWSNEESRLITTGDYALRLWQLPQRVQLASENPR